MTQFAPAADKLFSQSFGGIVWPRAAVGGGAFWNYNSTWAFEDIQDRFFQFASVLEARGLRTCPGDCVKKTGITGVGCDYGFACGVPWK